MYNKGSGALSDLSTKGSPFCRYVYTLGSGAWSNFTGSSYSKDSEALHSLI